jgi:F0F1-type ATP synthase assembly protein I
MITAILISLLVGFVAGALVFRKHATKATELELKGRQALDALKGRK